MAAVTKEIKFIAVARRSDKTILAHRIHTVDKSYDYLSNVQKVRSNAELFRTLEFLVSIAYMNSSF